MALIRFDNWIVLIFGSALILIRNAINASDFEFGRIIAYDNFEHYKASLNKTYEHSHIEERSRRAYEENCQWIQKHNHAAQRGKYSFELRPNSFADLTPKQYMRKYVRLQASPAADPTVGADYEEVMLGSVFTGKENVPETLDWRKIGFETSAKNQKSCGACYAFSIALSIEGQIFRRTGKLIELSEQQIVDCSTVIGNHGCGGGSLRNTLKYLTASKGLMRHADYPYTASQNKCHYRPELAVTNITNWAILPRKDEQALKEAVAKVGPIPISINASPRTFQLYSHGVYDDEECSSDTVNHAMLIVGYTPEYWILKNWWGQHWGEDGYMKIRRNSNMCGLANYAAYAVV